MLEVTKAIIAAAEKAIAEWEALKAGGKINAETALDLIYALVKEANVVITEAKQGRLKEQMVMDAFAYFDDKYKLMERLDKAVDLPWWLEAFDQKAFREGIRLFVRVMVKAINRESDQVIK